MAIDLKLLIESEFDLFKDRHTAKRGPRHRRDGVGLNLNRKHQNIIAAVHKADPNQIGPLEKLRGMATGRSFVTFQEGDRLRQKYGIQDDVGFLGTTGIKMIKTQKGYDLVKEAIVVDDGVKYKVTTPDSIWNYLPGRHVCFSIKNNTVFYMEGVGDTHAELQAVVLDCDPKAFHTSKVKTFPKITSQLLEVTKAQLREGAIAWVQTVDQTELEDWGFNGNPRILFDVSGRLSLGHGIVAFWNPIVVVNKHVTLLRSFFKHIGFTNDPVVVTKDMSNGKLGAIKNTTSVQQTVLKNQHRVPQLKKIAGANPGSDKLQARASSAGYKSAAEYDSAHIVGDSVGA